MKKILVSILLFLTIQQFAAAQLNTTPYDTIRSRYDRYHYGVWYDTCPIFLYDSITSFRYYGIQALTRDTGMEKRYLISRDFTSHPIAVKGLAAMVMPPETMSQYGYGYTSLSDENLPEYLMLFQSVDTGLLLLGSPMRWDTIAPRVIILPLNNFDSNALGYCHVYETYFKAPIYVDPSSSLVVQATATLPSEFHITPCPKITIDKYYITQ